MWKFKWLKGKDKWLLLLTSGIILCILAFPAGRLSGKRETKDSRQLNGSSAKGTGQKEETDGSLSAGWQSVSDSGFDEDNGLKGGSPESYEEELEHRVREILKNVEGVGQVDVMIVLESSAEKVIQVDKSQTHSLTEEQDSSGGTRRTENQEQERSTVLMSEGGESSPLIAKELRPELSGIIISAEGGGNPTVKAEISAAMEALFGLPAHKIKVLKRVE